MTSQIRRVNAWLGDAKYLRVESSQGWGYREIIIRFSCLEGPISKPDAHTLSPPPQNRYKYSAKTMEINAAAHRPMTLESHGLYAHPASRPTSFTGSTVSRQHLDAHHKFWVYGSLRLRLPPRVIDTSPHHRDCSSPTAADGWTSVESKRSP